MDENYVAIDSETEEHDVNISRLRAIRDAEDRVAQAERVMETARREAKSATNAFDDAVSRMRSIIRSADEPELPFGDSDAADGWRTASIALLGLPDSIAAGLIEGGYETVGSLADLTASGSELTDIPGVGEFKAAKIEDALTAFWAAHPEYVTTELE